MTSPTRRGTRDMLDALGGEGVERIVIGKASRSGVENGGHHQARVELGQSAVAKGQALQVARIEALNQEVGLFHCGGYLHFESVYHGATTDLFRRAKARGLTTSIDTQFPVKPLPRPWLKAMADILPYVDVLFVDEREARNLADREELGEAATLLREAGPPTVVIKQGSEGSSVRCRCVARRHLQRQA